MEAMKMFSPMSLSHLNTNGNELYPANKRYRITRILNSDAQQVNQGDLLFVIKPITNES
jgi:hypothetical protein